MKKRCDRYVAWTFLLSYASLGAGCFWHEGRHDPDRVEPGRGDHDRHEREHDHDRHDERRDNDRH
jgi:hypothetical protein